MSVNFGITGLNKSGRTTVLNALTEGKTDTGKHSPDGSALHIGTARVPEPRLQALADILHPKSVVPSSATYIDIGASVRGLVKDDAISGQLLARLSEVDAVINVIRAFNDESVPHVEGSVDVVRDIAAMNLELAFSDLALLERRLSRIDESLKGAKPQERQSLLREQGLLTRLKAELENDTPIRGLNLTEEEAKALASFQFLTAKPLLAVVNIGEDQLAQAAAMETELNSSHAGPECCFTTLCAKLEMELAQMDAEDADELRAEFGSGKPGADRVIRSSYELLGLITFFTVASNEVKAWPVRKGTDALRAAGKIHSDMERGFIRAEVIGYDDLMKCGGLPEARKQGLLRLEGKTYTIQDGDVITFLFNV